MGGRGRKKGGREGRKRRWGGRYRNRKLFRQGRRIVRGGSVVDFVVGLGVVVVVVVVVFPFWFGVGKKRKKREVPLK